MFSNIIIQDQIKNIGILDRRSFDNDLYDSKPLFDIS